MVLKSRVKTPRWDAWGNKDREAKCRKFGIPVHGHDPWFDDPYEAAEICNGVNDGKVCPFRRECLHASLVNNEQIGVFGGLHVEQRKWVRSRRPQSIANNDDPNDEEPVIDRLDWEDDSLFRHLVPSMDDLLAMLEEGEPDADEEEVDQAA